MTTFDLLDEEVAAASHAVRTVFEREPKDYEILLMVLFERNRALQEELESLRDTYQSHHPGAFGGHA